MHKDIISCLHFYRVWTLSKPRTVLPQEKKRDIDPVSCRLFLVILS